MNTPDNWIDFWEKKSRSPKDFQATGRGKMDIVGFLFTVREIARLLELNKEDTLLDIGCGTGIIALALSPWVSRLHGMDVSQNMVARARANCAGISNVSFSTGNIMDFTFDLPPFNKVLAYSVLQYLEDKNAVCKALSQISKTLQPGGRVLLAANPDPAFKDSYMKTIEGSGESPEAIKINIALTEKTLWVSRQDALDIASSTGFEAQAIDLDKNIWQHFYMYDLLLTKKE